MSKDTVTLSCRNCESNNRIPIEKALRDLAKVKCGKCSTGLLRVSGEPLTELNRQDLCHPWDKEALDKLMAIPMADTIISKVFGATFDKLARFYSMASLVRVNERQAPRLWRLYLEAAGRVNCDPPPLFIAQNPTMNAFAGGAGQHYITVTSGLLDKLEDREILGVLGHELTHVRLGHVKYQILARLLAVGGLRILNFFGLAKFALLPIQIALTKWTQMAELSADRGELLATGSLESFVKTHMLLAGGTSRFQDELNVAAFIDQAHDAEKMKQDDILITIMEMLDSSTNRSHPLPAWRVHHGLKWSRTDRFFQILAGHPTKRIEGS